ncbi:hypothetical protein C0Z01_09275 [Photobacterium kishitanii]|uniref:LPP20 lipoprotein n=1 Tax=Photobacterium kishitanii TaxID=318456 RepID=A0A2T3KJK2_9GAMM|nr:hypothetical protein AYY22_01220 [Photobacterium kishitanii]PSU87536.1 hypothetical protein C0W42_16135 [Photobacterium kishitanii]PSU91953.1 hypothetical protein C0W35_14735 [Photobacterium kishitanii]PSU99672.1 hypothetical protein C9J27_08540 [Photobacterium kishitanii]PSW69661.1 hypothetical protein C0Z01_09275 [Photobacterium kishitanii]
MINKTILSIFIVGVLSSCASTSTSTIVENQNFSTCTYPDAPKDKAPAWICDVMPSDISTAAMGYAKKNAAGLSVMRKVAMNDARVMLASQFEIDVNNMFKQAMSATTETANNDGIDSVNEAVFESFENATKTVVSRSLINSKVLMSQMSPTGGLYVLVGMNEQAYKTNVNSVVAAVGQDSKLWKKFNNEKAAENLTKVLDSLKQI